MMRKHGHSARVPVALCLLLTILAARTAAADENDPPSRAARLAYAQGSVSFQPAGTADWVTAPLNRPLTTGDQLWADRDGRAELQLDASILRVSSSTAVSFLNLSDHITQIQLSAGTLVVHVRRLADQETYEVDTPNLAFTVLRPGTYRLSVDEAGSSTTVDVQRGQGEVTGGGAAYSVGPGENDVFTGTDQLVENAQSAAPQQNAFDAWSAGRDARWDHSASAQYVSADVVGYEDLDEHGTWTPTPEYGHVWFPRGVSADWAPYHEGHWAYIEPWGYTWVDDSSWGFAPFHYGRWVSVSGAWGWVPAPPAVEGVVYVRPVYAPALVAWVGVGAGVAWFALAPREVYVPSYPVSRNYVTNVNISNTTVNTTVINNVYNTTVVNNNTTNVTNVRYVNRTIPGAIAATTTQAFASAQPVHKNLVRVDAKSLGSAPVKAVAPTVVPTKQAVLGASRPAAASVPKPPPAVQSRPVIARTAPPPPAPTFERHQEAIKNNGGKPLSAAQVHEIAATAPARPVAVKIAPPAPPPRPVAAAPHVATPAASDTHTATTRPETKPTSPAPVVAPPASREPAPAAQPAVRPAPPVAAQPSREPPPVSAQVTHPPAPQPGRPPAPPAVHPNELPPAVKPPSPSIANSALEREHLQQQQQLHAQQEADRLRLQQQQELEHQRLAKEAADKARQQQVEQQHAQQTQALAQQHAQEQEQMRARQEAQRRPPPPPPAQPPPRKDTPPHKDERPPVPK